MEKNAEINAEKRAEMSAENIVVNNAECGAAKEAANGADGGATSGAEGGTASGAAGDAARAASRLGRFSFFRAPIRPYRDELGRFHGAELVPRCEVDVLTVWTMITRDERLRSLTEGLRGLAGGADAVWSGGAAGGPDAGAAGGSVDEKALERAQRDWKSTRLPYVTPCGVFRRRAAKDVVALSGLIVLDIDHLESLEEAERVRDELFGDELLGAVLAFVSPSGRGVKLLVPWVTERRSWSLGRMDRERFEREGWQPTRFNLETVSEQTLMGMDYLNAVAQCGVVRALTRKQLECDFSGKDVSRACFLGHDSGAKFREFCRG